MKRSSMSDSQSDTEESTEFYSDEEHLSSRKLSAEELQAYTKPFADREVCRRGSCCSVRPENVPELHLNKRNSISQSQVEKFQSTIFSKLQEDIKHYGNVINVGSENISAALQRILLFPVNDPERNNNIQQKRAICNQFARKLLPALGIFHSEGDIFGTGDEHEQAQQGEKIAGSDHSRRASITAVTEGVRIVNDSAIAPLKISGARQDVPSTCSEVWNYRSTDMKRYIGTGPLGNFFNFC